MPSQAKPFFFPIRSAFSIWKAPGGIRKASGFYLKSFWVLFEKLLGSIWKAPGFYSKSQARPNQAKPSHFFWIRSAFSIWKAPEGIRKSSGFYLKSFWVLFEKLLGSTRKVKPNQAKPSKTEPRQAMFFSMRSAFSIWKAPEGIRKASGFYLKSFWVLFGNLLGSIWKASGFYLKSFWALFGKPSQAKPSQAKPSQAKPFFSIRSAFSVWKAPEGIRKASGFYLKSFWVLFELPSQAKPFFFNTLRLFYLKGSWRYSKIFWVLFEKLLGSIWKASGF